MPDSVFNALALLHPSERGEYELTDAIGVLLRAGATVMAIKLDSDRVNVNTQADLERAAALVE
jgi:dTDP-glucose pyrophosphorylase